MKFWEKMFSPLCLLGLISKEFVLNECSTVLFSFCFLVLSFTK